MITKWRLRQALRRLNLSLALKGIERVLTELRAANGGPLTTGE